MRRHQAIPEKRRTQGSKLREFVDEAQMVGFIDEYVFPTVPSTEDMVE